MDRNRLRRHGKTGFHFFKMEPAHQPCGMLQAHARSPSQLSRLLLNSGDNFTGHVLIEVVFYTVGFCFTFWLPVLVIYRRKLRVAVTE